MSSELEPMPGDWQRALAIVAHPDDLEYGVSGAIAAWTDAGKEVTYLLVTRGEAGIDTLAPEEAAVVREAEQHAAADVVGVRQVDFLDYRDGVIEYGPALRRDLSAAIRRYRPELVVTLNHHDGWAQGGWNTPDHRAVGRAVIDASSDAGNRWIFPELVEAGLEPWDGVRWIAVAASPQASHDIDVSATRERAIASLLEHRAYLSVLLANDPTTDPETYVRQLLTDRVGFELFTRH